jgi:hypothetical protein
MLLAHAVLFAEARSYLAQLADTATDLDVAMEYERVLLQLDHAHGDQVTPITPIPTEDRGVLYDAAREAISRLADHSVDRFELAICLAMLAHTRDFKTNPEADPETHLAAGPEAGS